MKKKFLYVLLAVSCVSLFTGCKKQGDGAEGEQTGEQVGEVADAVDGMSETGEAQEGVVQSEGRTNAYISTIGEMEDPYCGTIGVEQFRVDRGDTYENILNSGMSYKLIYSRVDGVDSGDLDNLYTVPHNGTFSVAFAPDGITNVTDPSVIEFTFGVPYDMEKNDEHYNVENTPLAEFILQNVTFRVHDVADNQTGNGLSIPGYPSAVLTKDDIIIALGGENKEYVVGEFSSSVSFHKSGTCINEVTAEFNESGNLGKVSITYDVNFDTAVGSSAAGYDISKFQEYLNSSVSASDYVGYSGLNGIADVLYVSKETDYNANTGDVLSVGIFSTFDDSGEIYRYGDLSFGDELMSVHVDSEGYLYCLAGGRIAQVSLDRANLGITLERQATKLDMDDGSVSYLIWQAGDDEESETEDSGLYDSLYDAYNSATPVFFANK